MKLFTYLLFTCCSMSMCSCLTTHKTKSSKHVETDSSSIAVVEKKGISITDSSNTKISDSSFQDIIQVIYDTIPVDFICEEDPVQRAIDLAGPQKVPVKKKAAHSININGNIIQSNQPVKEIKLITGGRVIKFDGTTLMKKDSGQLSEAKETQVKKLEKTKDKEVDRKTSPVLFVIGGIAFMLLILYLLKLWPFTFLFNPKKKSDE